MMRQLLCFTVFGYSIADEQNTTVEPPEAEPPKAECGVSDTALPVYTSHISIEKRSNS